MRLSGSWVHRTSRVWAACAAGAARRSTRLGRLGVSAILLLGPSVNRGERKSEEGSRPSVGVGAFTDQFVGLIEG